MYYYYRQVDLSWDIHMECVLLPQTGRNVMETYTWCAYYYYRQIGM